MKNYPEPCNADRAEWATTALERFCRVTGLSLKDDGPDTAVSDLLADLMHYCDQEGIDFDECVDRGRCHYEEEKAEEQPKKRRTKS